MVITSKMLNWRIVSFLWYCIIFWLSLEGTYANNSSKEVSLLDKFQQHDYNITFERVEMFRYNKRYINTINVVTYKYNRTTAVVNGSQTHAIDFGYELELVTQLYRFASNEYRLFACRFQLNFCKLLEKNVMGIGDFKKCGTFKGCPLVKNKNYIICNWTPNPALFPPLIPSGQYMFELAAMFRSVEVFTVRAYATIFRPVPGSF